MEACRNIAASTCSLSELCHCITYTIQPLMGRVLKCAVSAMPMCVSSECAMQVSCGVRQTPPVHAALKHASSEDPRAALMDAIKTKAFTLRPVAKPPGMLLPVAVSHSCKVSHGFMDDDAAG